MRVHLSYFGVVVVVLWSDELSLGELEFVYFYGSSVGVEIVDVKGFELLHEGCCVCSGWNVAYQPNEFLL